METGAIVENLREVALEVIVPEVEHGEVFEVADRRWDRARDVFVVEEKSGDVAGGALNLRPGARRG